MRSPPDPAIAASVLISCLPGRLTHCSPSFDGRRDRDLDLERTDCGFVPLRARQFRLHASEEVVAEVLSHVIGRQGPAPNIMKTVKLLKERKIADRTLPHLQALVA